MCGRFTLAVEAAELEAEFRGVQFPTQFAPRYNIAPSQPVLAIPNSREAVADFFIWGLVPSWAKDPSIGDHLINARGETLAEKPAFKGSYKYKRCLILADGFYEWKSMPGTKLKIPHYAQLQPRKPFGICGLWSEWRAGWLRNAHMHNRDHNTECRTRSNPQSHAGDHRCGGSIRLAGPSPEITGGLGAPDSTVPGGAHDGISGLNAGEQSRG